jgi:hypothetical protein
MSVALTQIYDIFKKLETGDESAFFTHVADDVDWIVEGTHPLAGHYHRKAEFLAHTFEKLGQALPQGAQLHVEHALVSGDWAVVELRSLATAKNGLRFDNRYCWVCRFRSGKIVEVRAYLDSALVARLFQENPITEATRAAGGTKQKVSSGKEIRWRAGGRLPAPRGNIDLDPRGERNEYNFERANGNSRRLSAGQHRAAAERTWHQAPGAA